MVPVGALLLSRCLSHEVSPRSFVLCSYPVWCGYWGKGRTSPSECRCGEPGTRTVVVGRERPLPSLSFFSRLFLVSSSVLCYYGPLCTSSYFLVSIFVTKIGVKFSFTTDAAMVTLSQARFRGASSFLISLTVFHLVYTFAFSPFGGSSSSRLCFSGSLLPQVVSPGSFVLGSYPVV